MKTTEWFADCTTEQEIKALYRDLAKAHHPDLVGGDGETMKEINAEYEARMTGHYTSKENATEKATAFWQEREKEMMEILAQLLKIDGVEIEIIGVWVWITGDTRPVKEQLKEHGCRWSRDKGCWYWRSKEHKWKGRRSGKSLDDLRNTWGTTGTQSGNSGTKARRQKALAYS